MLPVNHEGPIVGQGEAAAAVVLQVYENYNRFITATDTIRELKTNIDAASPSMTQLHNTSGAATVTASKGFLQ